MTESRTSHTFSSLPERSCPLCGADNLCQPATSGTFVSQRDTSCWCMNKMISPQALEKIPSSSRNKACLCPSCAALGNQAQQSSDLK